MLRLTVVLAAIAALAGGMAANSARAQTPSPGVNPGQPTETSAFPGSMTHGELQDLADYVDRAHMLTGRDSAKAKEEAKVRSIKLASAIPLSCEMSDAEQVGKGKSVVDGKRVDVNVYEIACANGMGYFLVSQGSAKPIAMSCFAALATHTADVAAGKQSDMYCQLPANKDMKATAAVLMSGAGATCAVQNLQWFGQSAATQTEYQEIVCEGGNGYLLRTALPGATSQTQVMSCAEAAKQGLKCRLTDAGPVSNPVTLDTLKAAIAGNGVNCQIDEIRLIGQENVRKRYVVEVKCPEQPKGLVAFIPLEGNTNPFETMDCADAFMRKIACKFTSSTY